MRIIPAIDIINGKCVRLSQGDYKRVTFYSESPLDIALRLQDHGFQYLHLVDLDGARSKKIINYKVLEQLATRTDIKIDFGGGIKSNEDLHIAFDCGASQITAGSIAVQKPDMVLAWLQKYSSGKIILGADAKNEKVAITGWTEDSGLDLLPFIKKFHKKGFKYVVCTDIEKDGMLAGPAINTYSKILQAFPKLLLIASGGVSNMKELQALAGLGCSGAIIGKALLEGHINLKVLERFNLEING